MSEPHGSETSLRISAGDYALADYRRLAQMPGNDVAQVHRYLDLGARYPVCHEPVDVLAADAVRTLLAWEPTSTRVVGGVRSGRTPAFRPVQAL